jgi:hypothetical protein
VIAARRQMAAEVALWKEVADLHLQTISRLADSCGELQKTLDELHECRQQRDRARMQARDRLTRIAERHANNGHSQCSWCCDAYGDLVPFPCPDYRDATGAQS